METNASFLESAKKQFLYYKMLGEKAINQLEDEQLFISLNEETNSIAQIVKHLSGNMLSRWTDFLTLDGEKEWRDRDGEFVDTYQSKDELLENWNKGWDCLFNAINPLQTIFSVIYHPMIFFWFCLYLNKLFQKDSSPYTILF